MHFAIDNATETIQQFDKCKPEDFQIPASYFHWLGFQKFHSSIGIYLLVIRCNFCNFILFLLFFS